MYWIQNAIFVERIKIWCLLGRKANLPRTTLIDRNFTTIEGLYKAIALDVIEDHLFITHSILFNLIEINNNCLANLSILKGHKLCLLNARKISYKPLKNPSKIFHKSLKNPSQIFKTQSWSMVLQCSRFWPTGGIAYYFEDRHMCWTWLAGLILQLVVGKGKRRGVALGFLAVGTISRGDNIVGSIGTMCKLHDKLFSGHGNALYSKRMCN